MLCAVPDAHRNGVESPTETDFIVKIFQNKAGLWFFFLQEKKIGPEKIHVFWCLPEPVEKHYGKFPSGIRRINIKSIQWRGINCRLLACQSYITLSWRENATSDQNSNGLERYQFKFDANFKIAIKIIDAISLHRMPD